MAILRKNVAFLVSLHSFFERHSQFISTSDTQRNKCLNEALDNLFGNKRQDCWWKGLLESLSSNQFPLSSDFYSQIVSKFPQLHIFLLIIPFTKECNPLKRISVQLNAIHWKGYLFSCFFPVTHVGGFPGLLQITCFPLLPCFCLPSRVH